MKTNRFELLLAATLAAAFLVVSAWQSARRLSRSEVDNYVRKLEESLPPEMEDRAEFISRLRAWGECDDGKPVYTLELMRYYDRVKAFPGAPTTGTPEEANAYYEDAVTPMLIKKGGYPILAGRTTRIQEGQRQERNLMVYQRELDGWDRVLVVRYPGRRTFLDLVTSPDYLRVMPYKLASLEVVMAPVSRELVIPDLRWVAEGSGLAAFLLGSGVHAARRSPLHAPKAQAQPQLEATAR